MRRATWVLLLLFAFAVPWEYSLELGAPFGNIARLLGLLTIAMSILALAQTGVTHRPGALQWAVLALFLWFCCSFFWTIDSEATLMRLRGYAQEMVAVWLVWEFADTTADMRWLLRACVAGSWVLAVLTIANVSALQAMGEVRFAAVGHDPNDVARFLALAFPMAALLAAWEAEWPGKLLALGYLPLGVFGVLLTASREGFLAAFVALTGSGWLLMRSQRRLPRWAWIVFPLLLAALIVAVPRAIYERLGTIPEQIVAGDLNQRLNIWDAGWRAFKHAPFAGTGGGTFVSATGLAPADTAHNSALSLAVEGGVGALLLASFVVALCAVWVGRMRGALRIGFGTALLVWMVTSVAATVEQTRSTWLLLGTIALAGRLAIEPGEAPVGVSQSPGAVSISA